MATAEEYMTVREAKEYLGVSQQTITNMLAEGKLPFVPHPLDKRSKLVRRADVERIRSMHAPRKRPTK